MQVLERDSILDRLRLCLREAGTGQGRLVLLAAEAGGGKTTVVQQLRETVNGGARVLVGNCDPLSTPRPLGPLLDMASTMGGAVQNLLAEAAPRDRVFGGFLDELSRGPHPTLAVFEDVHWADEATLDLLRFIGRRIASTRSVLLATYRDDEGPFRLALGDLATSAGVQRISLAPLTEDAVRILADGSGHDPVALHRRTGGNPFFVTEVLGPAGGGSSQALPQSVRDVVQAHAARLSAAARVALEACAVVGPRVDVAFLAELLGPEADAVAECLAIGLIRAEGLSLVFRNELGREAILHAISPTRRLMLHRQVLTLLRQRPTRPDDLAELAHHAEAAGDADLVLEFAPAAARRAASLSAHRQAVAQYRRALQFADRLDCQSRAQLHEALAHEYWVTDQVTAAIETRLLALEEWRSLGDRLREGDCLRHLARHYWYAARGADADLAVDEAIATLEPLPPGPELAAAYNQWAALRVEDGNWAEAIPIAERAIALAERFGYVGGVAYGRNTLGCALVMAGEPRGVNELEASIALARAAGLEEDVVRGYANLADCLSEQLRYRDLAALSRHLKEGLAYADDRELGSGGFCMVAHLSEWSMLTGDWSEAARVAEHVADIASDAHRLRPLTVLGRLRARRGDPDALPILDEALILTSRLGGTMWIGLARAARAEAAWLAGDQDATLVEARAGLDLLAGSSSVWITSELAYWRWKAGDSTPPPANVVEPYALQLAGRAREAAECWRALGCPYEAARALTELDSEDPLREALVVFERLGAKRSAALVTQQLRGLGLRPPRGLRPSTRANPAQLTERELEVLALLAEDLRDAEIADRLVLSSRTVGHHVSAILGKLGARSRGEAVRHATSLGVVPPRSGQPVTAK